MAKDFGLSVGLCRFFYYSVHCPFLGRVLHPCPVDFGLAVCLASASEVWAEVTAPFASGRFRGQWVVLPLLFLLCRETGSIPGRGCSLGSQGEEWEISVYGGEPPKARDLFTQQTQPLPREAGPEPDLEPPPLRTHHPAHSRCTIDNFWRIMKKSIAN